MSTSDGYGTNDDQDAAARRVAAHVPDDADERRRAFITLLRMIVRGGR